MKKEHPLEITANRRKFIKYSGALIGGMALPLTTVNSGFAANNNTLKVGLIGCGGRGAGAASQALAADPNVILTAMGDAFTDRLDESYDALLEMYPDRVKVRSTHR